MNSKYNYISEKLNERIEANLLPGFSLSIIEDSKVVYKDNKVYKGDEIFRLASMTKPITSLCALKAIELGLFNIDDDISKYIHDFNNMKVGILKDDRVEFDHYAIRNITIKDILRHESGLGSGPIGDYQLSMRINPTSLKEALEEYKNWYLDFDPGTKAIYSPMVAMDIVAYIIELKSHISYYDFLKKHILDPLNMKDTTYVLNENQKKRLALMYTMDKDKMKPLSINSYEGFIGQIEGFPSGSMGLFSTLNDYTNLVIMLSNKGIYNGIRILNEDSIMMMKEDIIPLPKEGIDEVYNWGYGVFVRGIENQFQPLKKGTFGWSGAYSPHFFVNIDDKTAVVFMTNLDNDGGAGSPNIKILEEAYSKCIKKDIQ